MDKGAGEGVKIVMMKRAGKPDYEAFFARIFGVEKKHTRKNLDVHVDPDGPVNPGGDDADDVNSRRARGDDDDETERLSADADDDNEKGNTMKTLMGLAKQYGWQAVAKNFVENGTGSFSETEVTEFLPL